MTDATSTPAAGPTAGESSLLARIRADLTTAMKARDTITTRTLRAVLAAVKEAEVSGHHATVLDNAGVEKVIAAQAKRRVEAAEAFDQGNRPEKAQAERDEQAILELYLPKPLTEDELVALIEQTLADEGLSTRADMGRAMKAVNTKVAGRADGRHVADLVKARLA